MVDGNFSAEHLKMHKPEKDVSLTHGEGYIVEETDYQQHLKTGCELKEVGLLMTLHQLRLILCEKSNCNNHRAIRQANAHLSNLEATGIGACACSRHGCFVPNSVVDFQKQDSLPPHMHSIGQLMSNN